MDGWNMESQVGRKQDNMTGPDHVYAQEIITPILDTDQIVMMITTIPVGHSIEVDLLIAGRISTAADLEMIGGILPNRRTSQFHGLRIPTELEYS